MGECLDPHLTPENLSLLNLDLNFHRVWDLEIAVSVNAIEYDAIADALQLNTAKMCYCHKQGLYVISALIFTHPPRLVCQLCVPFEDSLFN